MTNNEPVFEAVRPGALGGWERCPTILPSTDMLDVLAAAFHTRLSERNNLLERISEAERKGQWNLVAALEHNYRLADFRIRRQ